jgi:hypothetical protein
MVVIPVIPALKRLEAGGLQVLGQLKLHKETLSQKENNY